MPRAILPALILLLGLSTAAQADDTVARGRALAAEGDCVVCHTRVQGPQFAGGFPLHATPGTVYSSNITPDPETGIGKWNAEQFYRALHEGIAADGRHLYPAFPYVYFTTISRTDSDALFAYLKTLKPVRYRPPPNALIFPANIRFGMAFWNALYLDHGTPAPKDRGAALVNGISHCGGCHTPKNLLFADKSGRLLQGEYVDNWYAPNLTGSKRDGLDGWTAAEIVQYLKTGGNAHGAAAGSMKDVIEKSTSAMSDGDLLAIAAYLKSLKPAEPPAPHAPGDAAMADGQAVFAERCAVCHTQPGYPKLAGNTMVQSRDPRTVLRVILQGAESVKVAGSPAGYSMPAFPVLRDAELADVATYIRNSWGNRAGLVSPRVAKTLRKALKAAPD
ncbi:MAG TPA: cytochrome c [Rhizomicrobium sp.]|jgi:mono/diheme cytochrome c family protein